MMYSYSYEVQTTDPWVVHRGRWSPEPDATVVSSLSFDDPITVDVYAVMQYPEDILSDSETPPTPNHSIQAAATSIPASTSTRTQDSPLRPVQRPKKQRKGKGGQPRKTSSTKRKVTPDPRTRKGFSKDDAEFLSLTDTENVPTDITKHPLYAITCLRDGCAFMRRAKRDLDAHRLTHDYQWQCPCNHPTLFARRDQINRHATDAKNRGEKHAKLPEDMETCKRPKPGNERAVDRVPSREDFIEGLRELAVQVRKSMKKKALKARQT